VTAPTPDSWHWRAGPVEPGPTVVFDIDGVLSDAGPRQALLERPTRDWKAFFAAAGEDPLIAEVARLLELLDPGLRVVLLTARPMTIQDITVDWLGRHGLRWDLLIMRPARDFGPSSDFKRSAIRDVRAYGLDVRLGFEDDRRNVEMLHDEGIPCVYIHSGYYE
jgi:phosphoglycolate phosphatase-like HAD superfamily hydrolase